MAAGLPREERQPGKQPDLVRAEIAEVVREVCLKTARQPARDRNLHSQPRSNAAISVAVVSIAEACETDERSHVECGERAGIEIRARSGAIEMIKQSELGEVRCERVPAPANGRETELRLQRDSVGKEKTDAKGPLRDLDNSHRIVTEADGGCRVHSELHGPRRLRAGDRDGE